MTRKLKTLLFGTLVTALIVLSSLSGVYAILNWLWGAELRETMTLLRSQGNPLTMASLQPAAPSVEDDATRTLESLFCRMTSGPGSEIYVPGVDPGALDERFRPLLEQASSGDPSQWNPPLKPLAEIIDGDLMADVHATTAVAASKKGLRFPFDYERRPLAAVPHSILFGRLTHILCAAAIVQARNGNLEACHADLVNALSVVKLRADDPPLISQLSRCADARLLARTIRLIVTEHGIRDVQALKIINAIQSLDLAGGVKRGIQAERVMFGKNVFEPLILNQGSVWLAGRDESFGRGRLIDHLLVPVRKKDYTVYLVVMSDVAALFDAPYWDVEREGKVAQLTAKAEKASHYCPITRKILPDLRSLRRRVAEVDAELVRCVIAVALRVFHNNEGEYPETLTELEPVILKTVPANPLTGEPFSYRRTAGGFHLGPGQSSTSKSPASTTADTD